LDKYTFPFESNESHKLWDLSWNVTYPFSLSKKVADFNNDDVSTIYYFWSRRVSLQKEQHHFHCRINSFHWQLLWSIRGFYGVHDWNDRGRACVRETFVKIKVF
jgi:hypothetical protein